MDKVRNIIIIIARVRNIVYRQRRQIKPVETKTQERPLRWLRHIIKMSARTD